MATQKPANNVWKIQYREANMSTWTTFTDGQEAASLLATALVGEGCSLLSMTEFKGPAAVADRLRQSAAKIGA